MSGKRVVLWVVGEPGVGKTTFVRELLCSRVPGSSLKSEQVRYIASPKWTMAGDVCAAGHYSGETFDGADRIPYNGVTSAVRFWKEMLAEKHWLTILDGDRFAHQAAVELFRPAECCVLLLSAPLDVTEARRKQRASEAGLKLQNPTWVLGRRTKAKRFASKDWWAKRLRFEATMRAEVLVDLVISKIFK